MEPEIRCTSTPRLIMGLTAIMFGVVFTLDNMGVLDAGRALRYWPVILIGIGISRLVQPQRGLAGWIYLFLGTLFLINNLHLLSDRYWNMWPVVLVVIGIVMVHRAIRGPRAASGTSGDGFVKGLAILSGVERKSASQDFRGGDVAAFMGGCNVDLRQARIAGEAAVIEVFAMMGGIEIWVPETWSIQVEAWPILGGIEDKTRQRVDDPAAPKQRLIIKGIIFMGGIELKN